MTNLLRSSTGLAAAAAAAALLSAGASRADVLPDGKTFVPLALTIDGVDAFKDSALVLHGCSSEKGGRHQVAVSKSGQGVRCMVKLGVEVFVVPNKDVKAVEDLVAKDVGWGEEGMQARKLVAGHPMCGVIKEQTLVDKSSGTKELAARYAIEKTATGCTMKKVGGEAAAPAASGAPSAAPAAPSAAPATSAASSPAPSVAPSPAPAPSGAPAPKSGGCGATPAAPVGAGPALGFVALALGARARRRRA